MDSFVIFKPINQNLVILILLNESLSGPLFSLLVKSSEKRRRCPILYG